MDRRSYGCLPEVVPDTGPQVLTRSEVHDRRWASENNEKFIVVYDNDTTSPKIAVESDVPPAAAAAAGGGGGGPRGAGMAYPDLAACQSPMTPLPPYQAPIYADNKVPLPDFKMPAISSEAARGERPEPRILGLRRKMFWIVLVVAAIVIAAAVGGGVAGAAAASSRDKAQKDKDSRVAAGAAGEAAAPATVTVSQVQTERLTATRTGAGAPQAAATSPAGDDEDATRDKPSDDQPAEDSKPAENPPAAAETTTAKTTAKTTTAKTTAKPTATPMPAPKPEPGFEFKGWTGTKYTGKATSLIKTTGFIDLPVDVASYQWKPLGTDCCVTMCQGKTKSVGWRCTTFLQEKASATFDRLFIGCGAEASQASSRCK